MKYIHPTLKEEVPKKERRKIYNRAIAYLDNPNIHGGYGLCVILPVLLWDLEHYLDCPPHLQDNGRWSYFDTPVAFPELTSERLKRIDKFKEDLVDDDSHTNEDTCHFRIKILEEMLNDM